MNARAAKSSIESRIHDHYAKLADSERPLADMILGFPGQVASYSATELAAMAGVSKAAASRLVKKLGFDTYEDMRREARASQRWGSPHYLNSMAIEARSFEDSVQAHIACETENIRTTLSGLTPAINAVIEALAKAPRVGCIGFRRSRVVADYLRWSLVQIRRDVQVLPAAGDTMSETISAFDKNDLVIAVGLRRRVPLLTLTLRELKAQGIRTLLIADATAASIAADATWFICCDARSSSPFESDIAAISVAHFLSSSLASHLGNAARNRMQAVERTLAVLEELDH
jgi:DNA-binding MurR/RpiR family transcriptional regulator